VAKTDPKQATVGLEGIAFAVDRKCSASWFRVFENCKGISQMTTNVSLIKGAAAGLIAGFVASWVMNQFQAKLAALIEGNQKSHGAQSAQSGSPEHGAASYLAERGADSENDNAAERTANVVAVALLNQRLSKDEKKVGGTIFHYAFGASTGAFYGAVSELVPLLRSGLGLPFGLSVWALADEGVVPLLGLSKWPSEYPLSIHGYALASHLVYGLTTEMTHRVTRQVLA
jgi:hypothetical protein